MATSLWGLNVLLAKDPSRKSEWVGLHQENTIGSKHPEQTEQRVYNIQKTITIREWCLTVDIK